MDGAVRYDPLSELVLNMREKSGRIQFQVSENFRA
jgi:hypothetical protein